MAAVAYNGILALVDTATGTRTDVTLPDSNGSAIAFSADDARVALHNGGRIAVTSTAHAAWNEATSVEARGSVYRAALGKKVLVAAIRSGEHTMNLGAWRIDGDTLAPIGAVAGLELGASAVYHLHLDETNNRVLLGGVSGRGAFSGDGKPFTGIVELTGDLPLVWKGDGLPFRPYAYLYPLEDGQLVITQNDRFARIDLSQLPEVDVAADVEWEPPLERVALSPNGTIMAWTWAQQGDKMRLRTARAGETDPLTEASFALDGNFPALAVDDDGVATVVAGQRPDQLLIVRVDKRDSVETASVAVPSEPD